MVISSETTYESMVSIHAEKHKYIGHTLSVFSTPTNYGVVKIARSSSEVVMRTMKHTMIYPGSGPSSEVIALRPVV
jgi:hypothetical protein